MAPLGTKLDLTCCVKVYLRFTGEPSGRDEEPSNDPDRRMTGGGGEAQPPPHPSPLPPPEIKPPALDTRHASYHKRDSSKVKEWPREVGCLSSSSFIEGEDKVAAGAKTAIAVPSLPHTCQC